MNGATAALVTAVALCVVYGVLAVGSVAQLVRIHYYSKPWTPQKRFHICVFLVGACTCRGCRRRFLLVI